MEESADLGGAVPPFGWLERRRDFGTAADVCAVSAGTTVNESYACFDVFKSYHCTIATKYQSPVHGALYISHNAWQ